MVSLLPRYLNSWTTLVHSGANGNGGFVESGDAALYRLKSPDSIHVVARNESQGAPFPAAGLHPVGERAPWRNTPVSKDFERATIRLPGGRGSPEILHYPAKKCYTLSVKSPP